jgi:uncharacterized protein
LRLYLGNFEVIFGILEEDMIIDVELLTDKKPLTFSFEETLNLNKNLNLADFKCKVSVCGGVTKKNALYILKADVSAIVNFNCDKCLTPSTKTMELYLNENLSETDYPIGDDEVYAFSDNRIDLQGYILAELYHNIPMQVLCDEECLGLCPVCGGNLNKSLCTHSDDVAYDSRFEVLKSLFEEV